MLVRVFERKGCELLHNQQPTILLNGTLCLTLFARDKQHFEVQINQWNDTVSDFDLFFLFAWDCEYNNLAQYASLHELVFVCSLRCYRLHENHSWNLIHELSLWTKIRNRSLLQENKYREIQEKSSHHILDQTCVNTLITCSIRYWHLL